MMMGSLSDRTLVGEENETPFIRVWKPLSSIRVLKTLRGSPKGKAQRGQYLLAAGLGRYGISSGNACRRRAGGKDAGIVHNSKHDVHSWSNYLELSTLALFVRLGIWPGTL